MCGGALLRRKNDGDRGMVRRGLSLEHAAVRVGDSLEAAGLSERPAVVRREAASTRMAKESEETKLECLPLPVPPSLCPDQEFPFCSEQSTRHANVAARNACALFICTSLP